MTRTDVKICGIASPSDYDVCADAGVAFVGMVFYAKSPRHLSFCLLYTSPSPRDVEESRMPSSA